MALLCSQVPALIQSTAPALACAWSVWQRQRSSLSFALLPGPAPPPKSLPLAALSPDPLLAGDAGPVYPPEVARLLLRYAGPQPRSCLAVASERRRAEHLACATGFAVTPLLQNVRGTGSSSWGAGSPCRLQLPGPAGCAAAGGGAAGVAADGAEDLIVFADAPLPDALALQAAHRHLRPGGLLAVLCTDRDLASRFVSELEDLLEGAVQGYCRYDAQRDPAEVLPRLGQGGLFRLLDFSAFPHALRLPAGALLDALSALSPLRAALCSTRRRAFAAAVQRLAERHFGGGQAAGPAGYEGEEAEQKAAAEVGGSGTAEVLLPAACSPGSRISQTWVEIPLRTKAYVLEKSMPATLANQRSAEASQQRGQQPCIFCSGGA